MIPLRVRPEAEVDAFEIALWYEGEHAGLGGEFLRALREVFVLAPGALLGSMDTT